MTSVTYSASGTFVCPAGVTSVDCQAWGEGGNGAAGISGTRSGGGGGGGAFAEETTLAVTAGNSYVFTIGTGGSGTDTTFPGNSVTVTAHHGGNSSGTSGGTAGTAGSNTVKFAGAAGGAGVSGSSDYGGGGASSAGTGSAGAAGGSGSSGSPGTGGTAPSGGGGGGAGGSGIAAATAGTAPGGGGGGGGNRFSTSGTPGAGAAGQIILTYTVSGTTHSAAAALAGSGAMAALWQFLAAGSLSGSGSMSPLAALSSGAVAGLSGSGSMAPDSSVIWSPPPALAGTGSMSAHTVGFGAIGLAGTGSMSLIRSREFRAGLSGFGTLLNLGRTFGYSGALSGSGTLSVLQVLGVITAGAARSPVVIPQAWPGSSQVAVSPPGSSRLYWLGTLGDITALTYSYACPGGADKLTCTVMVPAGYRTQLFSPGWKVQVFRGGHQVWSGKLDEPQPTDQGWTLTAVGTGNLAQNFRAIFSSTWPASQPDQSINGAISRGLPWVNPGVGTPSSAWFGQAVDSGSDTIADLLTLLCTRGGLLWYVNSQPGGVPGDDLSVSLLPVTPNRLLVATSPVGRTLGGDINTIFMRYQVTADNSTTGAAATYATTSVQNAASAAMHGVMETYVDFSDAGVMSAGQAQTVGNYILQAYVRASYAGPFTARHGDLLTLGGQPIDPGTDQAGTMVQLIMTDFGYGGEVTPQNPVEFIVGAYEWDDFAQVATITPYQVLDQSISGLLSLESTLLQPAQASGG